MANSKYEYVKEFESHEKCLPNCWIVVRIDGRSFGKFAEKQKFKKPNDARALNLMTASAKQIMKEFPDVCLAYGQSDEYSFVLRKNTTLYNRRVHKFFTPDALSRPPVFDARVVMYPTDENLRDYLAWRQTDVHVNNLYNTCFWNLVLKKKLTHQEAETLLKGTVSSTKNELLFSEFGINYNNEPQEFRKGTLVIRGNKRKLECLNIDIIGDSFWEEHKSLLSPSKEFIETTVK